MSEVTADWASMKYCPITVPSFEIEVGRIINFTIAGKNVPELWQTQTQCRIVHIYVKAGFTNCLYSLHVE